MKNDKQEKNKENFLENLEYELRENCKDNEGRIVFLKNMIYNVLEQESLFEKYGTTNENDINELKEIFSAYNSKNIFDCFNYLILLNKQLEGEIKELDEQTEELAEAYKDLEAKYKVLKKDQRMLEEKIDDQNYIIEELGKSNNALLDGIEEIKKQKYDRILYSKIPGFGPGKYDRMKKYSKNISSKINKKPLNQKRKRGSKLK